MQSGGFPGPGENGHDGDHAQGHYDQEDEFVIHLLLPGHPANLLYEEVFTLEAQKVRTPGFQGSDLL